MLMLGASILGSSHAGAPPLAEALPSEGVNLGLLQRITQVSGEFMGPSWRAVAFSGLLAVHHFNERDSSYIAALAEEPYRSCDKRLDVSLADTGSLGITSVRRFMDLYNNATTRPMFLVGPARSASSVPAALVAGGVYGIPQFSYWSTSPKLNDKIQYPRFSRTICSDEILAQSQVEFWKSNMWEHAAVLYINDDWGEQWRLHLINAAAKAGITVTAHPYDTNPGSRRATIEDGILQIKESEINVILCLSFDDGTKDAVDFAVAQDMIGPSSGKVWVFIDAVTEATFASMVPEHKAALVGSLRTLGSGGDDGDPVWEMFKRNFKVRGGEGEGGGRERNMGESIGTMG